MNDDVPQWRLEIQERLEVLEANHSKLAEAFKALQRAVQRPYNLMMKVFYAVKAALKDEGE